jgi:hypothetical protein
MRVIGTVLMTILVAATVSGCGLLYPGGPGWSDFGPGDVDEGMPRTIAEYERGTATLVLTGGTAERVELTLVAGSSLSDFMGSQLYWVNTAGWGLGLMGYGQEPSGFGSSGMLQIDRAIRGHWTAGDSMGICDVTIERSDERAFRGRATCDGLRWTDAMGGMFGMHPPRVIEGQEPFDAEIVFEALP